MSDNQNQIQDQINPIQHIKSYEEIFQKRLNEARYSE